MVLLRPLLLLAVLGCAAAPGPGLPGAMGAQERALAGRAEVIDGDTLAIGETRIRLHGIDAPERAQRCGAGLGDCGAVATRALAALAGDRVACTPRDRDRHGRVVAVCRAGGRDLGAAMVAAGWALAYRRYSTSYVAEERAAAAARRGLWGTEFVRPEDWRRGERRAAPPAPEDCRIKGNVSSRGRIYHLPGSRWYGRTRIDPDRGERWFCSAAEAREAGWRAPRG